MINQVTQAILTGLAYGFGLGLVFLFLFFLLVCNTGGY